MNTGPKKCARPECGKTVYPIEELKCLDKIWHKQCFKCGVCGMTLNLKNYKGYNKTPYCEPHYPKQMASVVADTPEMRRLAENTKNQSLAKYHEEFERMKGMKQSIADDPEVNRHMKNTQVVSQVAYHGEMDRKEHMEKIRPPLEETDFKAPVATPLVGLGGGAANGSPRHAPYAGPPAGGVGAQPFSYSQQQQRTPTSPTAAGSPYSGKMQEASTLIYSSEQGGRVQPQQRGPGSIADYDPMNGQWGSAASSKTPFPSTAQQQQQRGAPMQTRLPQAPNQQMPPMQQQQQQAQPQSQMGGPHRRSAGGGMAVRAMYDYTAADTDEVTFVEGDVIVGCQPVDEGWMTGTVQRTGQWGMLPANYVERVH